MSLSYILVGIAVGFLSGIFGIGGSLICTPILKLFLGIPELIALASPLPVTIPTAVSGAYSYWQKGFVNKEIAVSTIIFGLPTTIFGAWCTKFINPKFLMILTGIMIVAIGFRFLNNRKIEIHPHLQKCPLFLINISIWQYLHLVVSRVTGAPQPGHFNSMISTTSTLAHYQNIKIYFYTVIKNTEQVNFPAIHYITALIASTDF